MPPTVSIPGIKSILICGTGTLGTVPTTPIYIGIGDKAKMTIAPYKTKKDSKQRTVHNMKLVTIECETLQPTLKMFNELHAMGNFNCDVQVVTEEQSSVAGGDDVFKFTPTTKLVLGLELELKNSPDGRSIKVTLKGAASAPVVNAIIDAADSETAVTVTGITQPSGEDRSLVRGFDIGALEHPISTAICQYGNIIDFSHSIKSGGKENIYGAPTIQYFTHKLEITMDNASIDDINAHIAKTSGDPVLLKLNNTATTFDAYSYAAGAIVADDTDEFGDEARTIKVTFEGQVRPFKHTLAAGTTNGGAAADAGLTGGTLTIG